MTIKRAKFILIVAVIALSGVIASACQSASAQNVPGQAAKSTQAAAYQPAHRRHRQALPPPVKYIGEFSISPVSCTDRGHGECGR